MCCVPKLEATRNEHSKISNSTILRLYSKWVRGGFCLLDRHVTTSFPPTSNTPQTGICCSSLSSAFLLSFLRDIFLWDTMPYRWTFNGQPPPFGLPVVYNRISSHGSSLVAANLHLTYSPLFYLIHYLHCRISSLRSCKQVQAVYLHTSSSFVHGSYQSLFSLWLVFQPHTSF